MKKANSGMRKGQVSAEVIIVTAAVLAVAFILVTQLQKTAQEGAKSLSNNANDVFKGINKTLEINPDKELKDSGAACTKYTECKSGNCNQVSGTCE